MGYDIVINKINSNLVKVVSSLEILDEIDNHFSFYVDNYSKSSSFIMKIWDGKQHFFDLNNQSLPMGLLDELFEFCKDKLTIKLNFNRIVYNFKEEEILSSLKKVKFHSKGNAITPYDFQFQYAVDALTKERQTLVSPTASGKSLTIFMIILYIQKQKRRVGGRVLLIVPTVKLVDQMYSDLNDYSDKYLWSDRFAHTITSGKRKTFKNNEFLIISTWQSIYKMESNWFDDFTTCIIDEAHMSEANSIVNITKKLKKCEIMIGTTGTLKQSKIDEMKIQSSIGRSIQRVSTKELMDRDILSKMRVQLVVFKYPKKYGKLIRHNMKNIRESNKRKKRGKTVVWKEEFKVLDANEDRKKIINRIIENRIIDGDNSLIIFNEYKEGKPFFEKWEKEIENCFWVTSENKVESDETGNMFKTIEENDECLIFSTFKMFSTGINIKNLQNVFLISSRKSRITILQTIGRSLRKSKNGKPAVIYDFVDDLSYGKWVNYAKKHAIERIKIYQEEEFDVLVKNVEMR